MFRKQDNRTRSPSPALSYHLLRHHVPYPFISIPTAASPSLLSGPLPGSLVSFPCCFVTSVLSPSLLSCSLLLHLIPNPVVLVPALSTRSLSSRLVLHWHSGVGCHGWVKSVGSPVYFAAVRAFRLKLQAAGLRAYQNKNNLWQCRDPWKEQYRCRSTRVQRLEWIICARKNVLIVFS